MKRLFLFVAVLIFFSCSGKSADDIFKDIDKHLKENDVQAVLDGYNKLYLDFPKIEKRPVVIFQLAYIYHNYFKNLDLAKKYYKEFVSTYPNHQLVKSAQFELDNLGIPAEELSFFKDNKINLEKDSVVKMEQKLSK